MYHIQDQNIKNIKVKKINSNLEIIDENGSVTVIEDFYLESNVELLAEDLASSTTYSGITNTTAIGDTVALTEVAVEIALPSSTGAAVGATVFGPGALAAGAGGVALAAGGSGGNNGSLDAKQLQTPTVQLQADGGEQGDGLTNNAALQVSETASDVTRTFSINGGTATNTYTAPTTDGDYTVVVTDTDTAGNTKNASITFTLDTTLDIPTVELAEDTGSSSTDKITQSAALTFSAAASDVTRSFKINDGAASTTYTAPTASGDYKVEVIDTDAAGNTKSASITFTLDISLDTPTVQLQADGGEQGDGLTNNAALQVSEAASDVTRTFRINGGTATNTYIAPTTDGDYTVVVTDIDTAGNTKNTSIEFSLDTAVDSNITIELTEDTGVSSEDNITKNGRINWSFLDTDTEYDTDLLFWSINGEKYTHQEFVDGISVDNGDIAIFAIQQDLAGNEKKTNTLEFVLDTKLDKPVFNYGYLFDNDWVLDETDDFMNFFVHNVPEDAERKFELYDQDGELLEADAFSEYDQIYPLTGAYLIKVYDEDIAGNKTYADDFFFTKLEEGVFLEGYGDMYLGHQGNDEMIGSASDEWFIGGDGNDTLDGVGGHNYLLGGAGNDVLKASKPTVEDPLPRNNLIGGAGDDVIHTYGGSDSAMGGAGNDWIQLNADAVTALIENRLKINGGEDIDILAFESIEGLTNDAMIKNVVGIEAINWVGSDRPVIPVSAQVIDAIAEVNAFGEISESTLFKSTHKQVLLLGTDYQHTTSEWSLEGTVESLDLGRFGVLSGLEVYTHNTLNVQFII